MDRNFAYELQQIGLDKNEAAVYLAALELGPSPVQKIAQRARVPRATTYLVLDELKRKGLCSTYEQGKKVYYNAEHPSELEAYLKRQESELSVRKKTLESLVPELEKRGQFPESVRPRVRYYEGKDAVAVYRRDLMKARKGQKIVRGFTSIDGLEKIIGDLKSFSKQRVDEGVGSRTIYADPNNLYPKADNPDELREAKEVDPKQYPILADVGIIGDFVGFMPYEEPYRAVVIEDPIIARTIASLFELAWKGSGEKK